MKRRSSGFTLVELMIVVAVLAIIASLAIPALLNSRMAANEASSIASLRTISTLNERYRVRFSAYAGSLNNLTTSGFIDSNLGSGLKSGYTYQYTGGSSTFSCSSGPETPGQSGRRYFFVDTTGVIRFSTTGTASSANSPIGQ